MKVYDCSNAFSQEFTLKPEWIGTIDFKLDRSFEILEAYKKIYKNDFNSVNKSILELLHLFNKHITEFNIETEQYTVRLNDEVIYLGLSNLGRGEKLFLLCYMGLKKEKNISFNRSLPMTKSSMHFSSPWVATAASPSR